MEKKLTPFALEEIHQDILYNNPHNAIAKMQYNELLISLGKIQRSDIK